MSKSVFYVSNSKDAPTSPTHLNIPDSQEVTAENRYVFAVTDLFTRWVEAYPLPHVNAAACIQKLEEVFPRFGYLQAIVFDNGTQFVDDRRSPAGDGKRRPSTPPSTNPVTTR